MTKKKIILLSTLSASTLILVPPLTMAAVKIVRQEPTKHQYRFLNQTFDSKADAINYGLEMATTTKNEMNVATS